MAASYRFQSLLETTLNDPELAVLRRDLSDPKLSANQAEQLRERFVEHPARQALQRRIEELLQDPEEPEVASWFVTDQAGLQLARAPAQDTVGKNYAWRSYFSGQNEDFDPNWRPAPGQHIEKTNLSAVYFSQVDERWTVTISTPIVTEEEDDKEGVFLGVIGLSVEVHRFMAEQQEAKSNRPFAVLVDWRTGPNRGLILQHPLFDKLLDENKQVPERFRDYRLQKDDLPDTTARRENYIDPLAIDPLGKEYDQHWLADSLPVEIRDGQTGWVVIVQESYQGAIGRTLSHLRRSLLTSGLIAIGLIAALSAGLWAFVLRSVNEPARAALRAAANDEGAAT
jgi:hypothetical protein